jgi:hypothetical protein
MTPELPIGLALLATAVTTLVGVYGISGQLKKKAKEAAMEAAAEVVRGDIGKEARERDIQAHAMACQFPINAHRELLESTGRIEDALKTQTDRIERLTNVVIDLARNGRK